MTTSPPGGSQPTAPTRQVTDDSEEPSCNATMTNGEMRSSNDNSDQNGATNSDGNTNTTKKKEATMQTPAKKEAKITNFNALASLGKKRNGSANNSSVGSPSSSVGESAVGGSALKNNAVGEGRSSSVSSNKNDTTKTNNNALNNAANNNPQNEGESSNNIPPAAATASANNNPSTAATAILTERQKQIIASIKHRRQLLSWIQGSRIQCQSINSSYDKGEKVGFVNEMLNGGAKNTTAAKAVAGGIIMGGEHDDDVPIPKKGFKLPTATSRATSASASATTNNNSSSSSFNNNNTKSKSTELADFATLTKLANKPASSSLLKRTHSLPIQNNKSNNNSNNNNTTKDSIHRELRRGASVGKKMANAVNAISHATGGGWLSSSTASSVDATSSLQQATAAGALHPPIPLKVGSTASSSSTAIMGNSQQQSGKQLSQGKQCHKSQSLTSKSEGGVGGSSIPVQSANTAASSAGGEKQKKARKRTNSTLKKSSLLTGGGHTLGPDGMVTLPGGMLAHYKHTHATNGAANMVNKLATTRPGGGGTNVALQHSMMKALVPSAMAVRLLERKDGLMVRLDRLMLKQHERQKQSAGEGIGDAATKTAATKKKQVGGESAIMVAPPLTVSSAAIRQSKPTETAAAAATKTIAIPSSSSAKPKPPLSIPASTPHHPPAQRLPPRTKTTWDCVLEEMKWISTDFHQERKWKMAAGKALGGAVKKWHHGQKKPKQRSLGGNSSTPTKRGTTPPPSRRGSGSVSKMLSSSRSTPSRSLSSMSAGSAIIGNDDLYFDATEEDVTNVQKIASLLSVSLLDYWDNPTAFTSRGQQQQRRGKDGRLQKLREGVVLPSLSSRSEEDGKKVDSSPGKVDQSRTTTSGSPTMNDNEAAQASIDNGNKNTNTNPTSHLPLTEELTYDQITSTMESSMTLLQQVKEESSMTLDKTRAIQKYKKEFMLDGGDSDTLVLGHNQLRAVHFLEKMWEAAEEEAAECNAKEAEDSADADMKDDDEDVDSSGKDDAEGGESSPSNNENANGAAATTTSSKEKNDVKYPCCASIIVGGGIGSGKTFATCALLWKQREKKKDGPHLIVCSPGSLIRWKHQLNRFDDLTSQIFDSNEEVSTYAAFDVVLCDYTLFLEVAAAVDQRSGRRISFASLILDLRHPSSIHDINRGEGKAKTTISSSPIESVKWWICLNNFSAQCSKNRMMNRLIIEQSEIPQNCVLTLPNNTNHKEVDAKGGKKKRSDDMMLAMKMAFIYNPSLFASQRDGASIGKRVILWAKRQAKGKKKQTAQDMDEDEGDGLCNGNVSPRPSAMGYRDVLLSSLEDVCESSIDLSNDEHYDDDDEPDTKAWEVRMCSLAKSQQTAYENRACCFGNMHRGGTNNEIAECLLQLRKTCLHTNLDEIVANVLAPVHQHAAGDMRGKYGSTLMRNSATFSEPSVDAAKRVIKKSSKMKELLRVLTRDCGYDVGSMMRELVHNPDEDDDYALEANAPKRREKVLILATLVEAQLLTSYFLSAVGLHHEVLVSLDDGKDEFLPSSCSTEISKFSPWAWSQNVLAQFNQGECGTKAVDIVIASPRTIASSGVGVTSVETVINIDEDWSGREALHILSIFTRIHRREIAMDEASATSEESSSCKFIKIICENTCEDTFICEGNTIKATGATKRRKREPTANRARRSTRAKSTRTRSSSKTDSPEEAGAANDESNDHHNSTLPKKTKSRLLCPIKLLHEHSSVNSDGLIVPTKVGGEAHSHKQSKPDHDLIGYNIARYRNSKLSSVLCATPSSNPGQLFMPTKGGRRSHRECDSAFALALFHSEDNASCIAAARHHAKNTHLPRVDFRLRSIALGPADSRFSLVPVSVQRYVEYLQTTHSFISQRRDKAQIHLLDRDGNIRMNGGVNSNHDPANNAANAKSFSEEQRKTCVGVDLLVYRMSNSLRKKRQISDIGVAIQNVSEPAGNAAAVAVEPQEDWFQSIFSHCFSSSSSSNASSLRDGSQGCEPMVFFPAFLPSLLQFIQQVAKDGAKGVKRKDFEGQFNHAESKRLRLSASNPSPNELITSPLSIRGDREQHERNVELTFNRRLLAADLEGILSFQSQPSLNSIILITQKKRLIKGNVLVPLPNAALVPPSDSAQKVANQAGKKSLHKKSKKHHHHSSPSPSREKGSTHYFRNDLLFARCQSSREGMKVDVAASLIGGVKSRCRLNDLVSNSMGPNLPQHDQHMQKSVHFSSAQQDSHPLLLGTLPTVGEESQRGKPRSQSGITLPVGVKMPPLSKFFSGSLEGSPEPWTYVEDSLLQECVSRYGLNWQLASHAISNGAYSVPALNAGGREGSRTILKRSPTQCEKRWSSLQANEAHTAQRNSTTAVAGQVSRFANELDGSCVIYDGSSPINQMKQEAGHASSFHRIGRSKAAAKASNLLQSTPDRSQPVLSRIQMLKEVSKKRRVTKTPMPSSAPMHQSHSDSIQAARASMLAAANGVAPPRNEMWPLELLCWQQQNKSSANQQHQQRDVQRVAPASHAVQQSSQSTHRQQASVPYHPNHNGVHPTQHQQQMYHGGAGHHPHPQYQGQVHHGQVAYQTAQPRIPQQHHHHRPPEPKKGST